MTDKITPNLAIVTKSIKYDYDAINRLISIKYPLHPENNVAYVYGGNSGTFAAKNQVGRIISVTDASGLEQREYGKLGELTKEIKTLPSTMPNVNAVKDTDPFTTEYVYDTWNRLQQMTYPDGELVKYYYDSGGLVRAISGSKDGVNLPYVKRIEYDQFEQRKFVLNGNGTKMGYDYRPDNRRLNDLKSRAGDGKLFQDYAYTYDTVGNITELDNLAPVAARNIGGPFKQTFNYDNLYRLTNANGSFKGIDLDSGMSQQSSYKMDMTYDEIHNITHKTQTAFHRADQTQPWSQEAKGTYDWAYSYQESGSTKPHAPTTIGERSFTYDPNGNQTGYTNGKQPDANRDILWDEENRIISIQDKPGQGGITSFVYNDAGERVIKFGDGRATFYINQFLSARSGKSQQGYMMTKHVYAGNTRMLTHLVPHAWPTPADPGNSGNVVTGTGAGNGKGNGNGKGQGAGKGQSGGNGKGSNPKDPSGLGWGAGGNTAFLTALVDAPVYRGADLGSNTWGIASKCETLTWLDNKIYNSLFYKVAFGDKLGFVEIAKVTVGESSNCGPAGGLGNGEKIFYYHPDHLGSVSYMTDATGRLYEHILYTPFGETWIEQRRGIDLFTNYQFTGKELDPETNLYYFGARYYDPRTSVWQSADPMLGRYLSFTRAGSTDRIGVYNPVNLELYGYGDQNPLMFVDADGKLAFPWHFAISFSAAKEKGFGNIDSLKIAWNAMAYDFRQGSQGLNKEAANSHAMRAVGQSLSSQKAGTDAFISNEIGEGTLRGLGEAMHAEEDKPAGGHRDHVWAGFHFLPQVSSIGKGIAGATSALSKGNFKDAMSKLVDGITEAFKGPKETYSHLYKDTFPSSGVRQEAKDNASGAIDRWKAQQKIK